MYVLPYGQMSLWGEINLLLARCYSTNNNKADKNFMAMFMGLVDGDGYIEIGPQKQYNSLNNAKSTIRARLVIRLHERDMPLLKYLTEVLGVGSISNLVSKNQTRLIFSKKDLIRVIIPLIKKYELKFLTSNRFCQYDLLNYIIDNNIIHWENVKYTPTMPSYSVQHLLNLSFFVNWVVGFTIAEGSFGMKNNGSAFFQIKQKGTENYNILKAISLLIVNKELNVKPDSVNCYQLSLISQNDIQKVVIFFSNPSTYLYGYKLIQYNEWLELLKRSNRYKNTIIPK